MKKHVAGIVLFALIITLSAIGYALFRTYPIPEIGAVETTEVSDTKSVCSPTFRRVRIVQAIANVSENSLALDLRDAGISRKGETISSATTIVLAFYNVESAGPRFVRSEAIEIEPSRWVNGSDARVIKYKHPWFEYTTGPLNLYARAYIVDSDCRIDQVPEFSPEDSTPVLLIGS